MCVYLAQFVLGGLDIFYFGVPICAPVKECVSVIPMKCYTIRQVPYTKIENEIGSRSVCHDGSQICCYLLVNTLSSLVVQGVPISIFYYRQGAAKGHCFSL